MMLCSSLGAAVPLDTATIASGGTFISTAEGGAAVLGNPALVSTTEKRILSITSTPELVNLDDGSLLSLYSHFAMPLFQFHLPGAAGIGLSYRWASAGISEKLYAHLRCGIGYGAPVAESVWIGASLVVDQTRIDPLVSDHKELVYDINTGVRIALSEMVSAGGIIHSLSGRVGERFLGAGILFSHQYFFLSGDLGYDSQTTDLRFGAGLSLLQKTLRLRTGFALLNQYDGQVLSAGAAYHLPRYGIDYALSMPLELRGMTHSVSVSVTL